MKRYAFIDIQNTASTTQSMLGFFVDWNKLYEYLRYEKGCEKIFFYTGIENGDTVTAEEFEKLGALDGCVIRSKVVMSYKRKDKECIFTCHACKSENAQLIDMGYEKKANCDVELTVDVLEISNKELDEEKEFLIFTGDGDFEFVIRKIIEKGVKVKIISHAENKVTKGITYSRCSKKLKNLVRENPALVDLWEINNWKFKIKKD